MEILLEKEMDGLALSFKLFAVGFPTVFAVLVLIVIAGSVLQDHLVPLLDQWFPNEEPPSQKSVPRAQSGAVQPEVVVAITTAVQTVTKGKYKVININKNL